MSRKVILDLDPGIADAVAACLAFFDPRLEVVALTAVAGSVGAEQATRNAQVLVERFDPPRWPRLGRAAASDSELPADNRRLYGASGLGSSEFDVAELHHQHLSDKVIADEIRQSPEAVTIVALGPLTNVAGVFRRDPALASQVGQLVILGGTVTCPGNVTPAAEFNMYCDPLAAREVFQSRTTKTLIPLDVATQVTLGFDFLDQLPPDTTRAGKLLRQILPFSFRSHRQVLGLEGIYVHEAVAVVAVLHPELFTMQPLAADVETRGELTQGATVFDRRRVPEWRRNVDVAVDIDAAAVVDALVRGLRRAGEAG
jgi:purine nucleosidase